MKEERRDGRKSVTRGKNERKREQENGEMNGKREEREGRRLNVLKK